MRSSLDQLRQKLEEIKRHRLEGRYFGGKDADFVFSLAHQSLALRENMKIIAEEADESCSKEMKNNVKENVHNPFALNQFMNIRASACNAIASFDSALQEYFPKEKP